jgi:hypothetical protein
MDSSGIIQAQETARNAAAIGGESERGGNLAACRLDATRREKVGKEANNHFAGCAD